MKTWRFGTSSGLLPARDLGDSEVRGHLPGDAQIVVRTDV